jgi:hypothetical protein
VPPTNVHGTDGLLRKAEDRQAHRSFFYDPTPIWVAGSPTPIWIAGSVTQTCLLSDD